MNTAKKINNMENFSQPPFHFLEECEADLQIESLVLNAAKIIPTVWPLNTFIACHPLQELESLKFEEAIEIANQFFFRETKIISSSTEAINRELIKWSHAFLDEGQATLTMPEREKGFYQAWSLLAPFDKTLNLSSDTHAWLASLPIQSEKALSICLKRLKIPQEKWEDYFRYALAETPGWAGYIKWRIEQQHQKNNVKNPITLVDFLAVRLIMTCLLSPNQPEFIFNSKIYSTKSLGEIENIKMKEKTYLTELLKKIIPQAESLKNLHKHHQVYEAQWMFCMDVRSEPLRRNLERLGNYETFGISGSFGLAVQIHQLQQDKLIDSCPALLKPIHKICEEPLPLTPNAQRHYQTGKILIEMSKKIHKKLKSHFGTSFILAAIMGPWHGLWMAFKTLAPRISIKVQKALIQKIMPISITQPNIQYGSENTGIPFTDQVNYAESALRLIGLTENFSPLLVICGHGSMTEKDSCCAALNCGACRGNPGGPNAKILAAILNDRNVRESLKNHGITIPAETLCIAAQHNTTTDEIVFYEETIPIASHKKTLEKLKKDVAQACRNNSHHRSNQLDSIHAMAQSKNEGLKRSTDWAEIRAEWGLARNAGFIAGPRKLTKELDLEGRCFLHSYDWTQDPQGTRLEMILTAPMVVAKWINLQYFFATFNPITYGSGSKVTHNIVGELGFMQGNASDLMHGLPLQSVYSTDHHPYHDSMRLQVVVYAERSMIESIIDRQPSLKTLFFNHWVILIAIDPTDSKPYLLVGEKKWEEYYPLLKLD